MPSKATTAQKIRVYFTGLVPLPGEQLEKEVRGRGWSMKMGLRPDKCRHDYNSHRPSHNDDLPRPEIVIRARDFHRAAAVLGLFMDSLQLLFGPEIWELIFNQFRKTTTSARSSEKCSLLGVQCSRPEVLILRRCLRGRRQVIVALPTQSRSTP